MKVFQLVPNEVRMVLQFELFVLELSYLPVRYENPSSEFSTIHDRRRQ